MARSRRIDDARMTNPLLQKYSGKVITYRDALWEVMNHAMETNPNAFIMGQGVDDFKGTFGTTLKLVDKYGPERVFDTPLAEEGMTGIGIGAAVNGLYPIQTHIRVDFGIVAMNQIVNLAAKYKYMSGGAYEVPMLIRMVTGRGWGQGAQHSQSLQSMFAHVPGLMVIMPGHAQTILSSYPYIISQFKGPVITIENRLMFDLQFKIDLSHEPTTSPLDSRLTRVGRDVTIVATSIMSLEALRAAEYLQKHSDIDCEVIDLHSISHPNVGMILQSVSKTGRLVIADTSWKPYGVAAEICRFVCEKIPSALKVPVETLGIQFSSCPTAKSLEDLYYPNLQNMVHSIAKVVRGSEEHKIELPDQQSTISVYRSFKGPF